MSETWLIPQRHLEADSTLASQCSNGIPDSKANSLQIGPQHSTSKINKSILLPTLRLRLKSLQTACLHNRPECGRSSDLFPDKNLSMFCVRAVWVQVQGKAQNGKAHWVPATTAKKVGPVFPGAATLQSPSNSLQLPSTASESTYQINRQKANITFPTLVNNSHKLSLTFIPPLGLQKYFKMLSS